MNSTTPNQSAEAGAKDSANQEGKMMQSGEMNAAVALTSLTSTSPDLRGEEFAGTEETAQNANTAHVALEPPTIDTPKNFPQMLMEILNDKENEDSISWLPHGCSFRINKREKFLNEVLPHYYKRSVKYTSFTRKLSRWDFVRLSSGPDTGAFYHKLFQRDNPKLVKKMFCKGERPQFIRTMAPHGSFGPPLAMAPGGLFPSAFGQGFPPLQATGGIPSYLSPSLRANMLLQNPPMSAYSQLGLPGMDALTPSALGQAYSEMESRHMVDAAMRALYRSEAGYAGGQPGLDSMNQDSIAAAKGESAAQFQYQPSLNVSDKNKSPSNTRAWAA